MKRLIILGALALASIMLAGCQDIEELEQARQALFADMAKVSMQIDKVQDEADQKIERLKEQIEQNVDDELERARQLAKIEEIQADAQAQTDALQAKYDEQVERADSLTSAIFKGAETPGDLINNATGVAMAVAPQYAGAIGLAGGAIGWILNLFQQRKKTAAIVSTKDAEMHQVVRSIVNGIEEAKVLTPSGAIAVDWNTAGKLHSAAGVREIVESAIPKSRSIKPPAPAAAAVIS